MKTPTQTPLQEVVCKNVKALLAERKTSVRELAISINRDHSQLNKVLNNQAIRLMRDSRYSRFYKLVRAYTGTRKRKVLSQPSLLSLMGNKTQRATTEQKTIDRKINITT